VGQPNAVERVVPAERNIAANGATPHGKCLGPVALELRLSFGAPAAYEWPREDFLDTPAIAALAGPLRTPPDGPGLEPDETCRLGSTKAPALTDLPDACDRAAADVDAHQAALSSRVANTSAHCGFRSISRRT